MATPGFATYESVINIGGNFFGKTADGVVELITEDVAQEALQFGAQLLTDISDFVSTIDWEAIGKAVGDVAVKVIKAAGELGSGFAKSIIPDIIEGAEEGYAIIANRLDGRGTQFVGGFTVAFLVVMTMVYIFYEVRRGK
tara:strand:- start:1085 stop:1504 length:420 start_codon:yes stop_codon:yes gene_type:complete